MRVFLTADVQLHNHTSFSTLLPSGISNRLQDGINALDQVLMDAASGDCIILLGDVFETQKAVDTSVMFAFASWMERAQSKGVRVVLVVGNHDHYTRAGTVHSLKPFEAAGVTVISRDLMLTLGGHDFFLKAYTDDIEDVKSYVSGLVENFGTVKAKRKRFLCLHQAVSGAMLASSLFEGALGLSDLKEDAFTHVFLGHFHKPQSMTDKVTYLGSPYQVTSEEAGDVKRFMVVEPDGTVASIRTAGNQFHRISFAEFETGQAVPLAPGYYRVICQNSQQVEQVPKLARQMSGVLTQVAYHRPDEVQGAAVEVASLDWDKAIGNWLSKKNRPDLVQTAIERFQTSS